MAIIYSYPPVASLETTDLFIISRLPEDPEEISNYSVTLNSLSTYIIDKAFNGTDNYIPKFDGTASLVNSVIYQDDDGHVGIGVPGATPNPVHRFEVYDDRSENVSSDYSQVISTVVGPPWTGGAGGILSRLSTDGGSTFPYGVSLIPGTTASDLAVSGRLAFHSNSNLDTRAPTGYSGQVTFDGANPHWILGGGLTDTTTRTLQVKGDMLVDTDLEVDGGLDVAGTVRLGFTGDDPVILGNPNGKRTEWNNPGYFEIYAENPDSPGDFNETVDIDGEFLGGGFLGVYPVRTEDRHGVRIHSRNATGIEANYIDIASVESSAVRDENQIRLITAVDGFGAYAGIKISHPTDNRFRFNSEFNTEPTIPFLVNSSSKFTDQVTIPLTPIANTDAASKGYVDGQNQNQVTGSGTVNTIPLWNTTTGLSDSVLSQTTPYIGPNTGILNINGTLKQSGTRKSIYIGENVGQSVNPTSGFLNIYNIGIGDDVLKDFEYGIVDVNNLEDPGDNVGIGYQALTNLTRGTNNVAIGTETLKTLTLGGNNIAFGKNSLLALTGTRANSIGNVALGFNTLSSMTTGTFNVAIGNTNFEAITTANSIVSIGNDIAKPFTGSASNLVMIGNKVLANTTATSITDGILIGQNSGLATSGTVTNDILIGRSVFQNNDSGGNNIAIGGNANQNVAGTVNTSIALTTRNGSGTGGNAGSYGIVISTYDSADVGVGSVNESTGKYSATIGGIGNLNQGGNGFIGGGKTNTIVATATNSAILGGFDNEVQSGGSGGMALGSNLQVNGNNQVVVGRFNTPNTNSKLIVGAGFSNANRINAFEVKNTSQLKLGKYGQTPANFPATSSSFANVLVVGAGNNVTEIPISNAEFNSQILTPGTRSVTAGSTTGLSAQESKLVKISWTGTTGNAILRLPLAGNFVNKTIRFITDDSFPATASAQITGNGGTETINGLTAGVTLTGTYQAIMVWSDGLEWWTLSKNY
jgi:hypothetical protein